MKNLLDLEVPTKPYTDFQKRLVIWSAVLAYIIVSATIGLCFYYPEEISKRVVWRLIPMFISIVICGGVNYQIYAVFISSEPLMLNPPRSLHNKKEGKSAVILVCRRLS